MRIGGLVRSSFIDFPGRIAAVVFTRGCNLRCPYCHNADLIPAAPVAATDLVESDVLDFLSRRRAQLDGVVVTGGEPTLQPDLASFLRTLKDWGYATKLDTNGTRPTVLRDLLDEGLVDYVAMDLKAPLNRYAAAAGVEVDENDLAESIRLLQESTVEREFRTTCVGPLLTEADLLSIGRLLAPRERLVLQRYQPAACISPEFAATAYSWPTDALERVCADLSHAGLDCCVR